MFGWSDRCLSCAVITGQATVRPAKHNITYMHAATTPIITTKIRNIQ